MTPELYLEIAKLALIGIIVTAFTSIFNTWRHRSNELKKAQLTKETAIEIAQGNRLIELEKAKLNKQTAIEVAQIEKVAGLEKFFTEHEIEKVNKLQEDWRKSSHIITTYMYHDSLFDDLPIADQKEYNGEVLECFRIQNEMKLLGVNTKTINEYINVCKFHHEKNRDTRIKASTLNLEVTSEIGMKYNMLREKHLNDV